MLDIALRELSWFDRKSGLQIGPLSTLFRARTHTAILGPAGSGKSLLLRLISGEIYPATSGEIILGTRPVTPLSARKRPVFHTEFTLVPPGRWSVRHLLIAAARPRKLNFQERMQEIDRSAARWELETLLERKLATLSSAERLRARLAQIELLRPAVLLCERLFSPVSPSDRATLAHRFHSNLREHGATVISEISDWRELPEFHQVLVVDGGRIVQEGTPADVYANPNSRVAAEALGEVNAVPVVVRGGLVDSPIGEWSEPSAGFDGSGFALLRPDSFELAQRGEESDFIFAVDTAGFAAGVWTLNGVLTGGVPLRVILPDPGDIHRGKLLPLRFRRDRARIVQGSHLGLRSIPMDVVPPASESR